MTTQTGRFAGWMCAALVCAAAASAPSSLGAQTATAIPAVLAPLVSASALHGRDLASVARGEPAVVSMDVPDHDEVALLGVVAVPVPRAYYAARLWTDADVAGTRVAAGVVHDPALPSDFARLSLSAGEANGLARCRPLHCSLKLPASAMSAFARGVDWSTDPRPRADSLLRGWLAERVNDFRARGDSALPTYDDTRRAERPAAGFSALLDESAALLREAPTLAAYLRAPPTELPAGVESAIYWVADHPEGSAPLVSVVQRATYTPEGADAPTVVVTKQLYADHYFDARLDVAALADGPPGDGGAPTTYAVVVRRVRFDKLASGGLFDLRGRVVRKLSAALRDELARTGEAMARAYRAGGER